MRKRRSPFKIVTAEREKGTVFVLRASASTLLKQFCGVRNSKINCFRATWNCLLFQLAAAGLSDSIYLPLDIPRNSRPLPSVVGERTSDQTDRKKNVSGQQRETNNSEENRL